MPAGVSNHVARVLGIYERKRAGLLLEIDEKPELPNNVIVLNFQRVFHMLTLKYSDLPNRYLASNITSDTK